jgi:hypothetical protein
MGNGKFSTQKINLKILIARKKNLFKIEHVILLTKKGKNINFDFFGVSKFFYVHDKKK